jgi:hypothetical protein
MLTSYLPPNQAISSVMKKTVNCQEGNVRMDGMPHMLMNGVTVVLVVTKTGQMMTVQQWKMKKNLMMMVIPQMMKK